MVRTTHKSAGHKSATGKTTSKASKPKPPWDKAAPKNTRHGHLTLKQKQVAKNRAAKAGRPYPNRVDNMWAAKKGKRDQAV
jgi:hypothetical protein